MVTGEGAIYFNSVFFVNYLSCGKWHKLMHAILNKGTWWEEKWFWWKTGAGRIRESGSDQSSLCMCMSSKHDCQERKVKTETEARTGVLNMSGLLCSEWRQKKNTWRSSWVIHNEVLSTLPYAAVPTACNPAGQDRRSWEAALQASHLIWVSLLEASSLVCPDLFPCCS